MRVAVHFLQKIKPITWFLVAYAIYGLALMPQYGLGVDEKTQEFIGIENFRFIKGAQGPQKVETHKYFGPIVEMAINLVVDISGFKHTQARAYTRHTCIWLIWLACIYFFYKTCTLLVSHTPSALLATMLFSFSPHLFAHAHYNSKDLVFLSILLFSIYCLLQFNQTKLLRYLIFSAIWIGIATSIRSVGALLAIIMLLHLFSSTRRIVHLSLFAVIGLISLYAVYPYLWLHPICGPPTIFLYANQNPWPWQVQFAGKWLQVGKGVWYYVPLALAITVPLATLFLYVFFIIRLLMQASKRMFNANQWFLFNLFCIPLLYIVFTKPYFYNLGRHTLFFQLLLSLPAVFVVHAVWQNLVAKRMVQGAVAITGLSLVAWFSNEMVYFNAIKTSFFKPYSFELDYWGISGLRAMNYLLNTYPNEQLKVFVSTDGEKLSKLMLATHNAERLQFVDKDSANFELKFYRFFPLAIDSTCINYFGSKAEPYLVINKLK